MNILYLLFGKSILKAVKANEMRPPAFAGMSFAFLDHQGNEYYTWPDVGSIPPVRFKEIQAQMVMVDSGTGTTLLNEVSSVIIEKCSEAIQATGPAKDERIATIAALCRELVLRRNNIIPEEALYALAAVCCARRDEDPRGLDRVIHSEKIEAFTAAGRAGDAFFLDCPCLKQLIGASICTLSGYLELRRDWMMQKARTAALIEASR